MTVSQVDSQLDKMTARGKVEDRFFVGMSLLLMATVLVGFAKSYFLAGLMRSPLPNKLIHVHAVFFSCWIVLLIAQASFISTKQFDLHRQVGLLGFCLACGMIVVGVMAATDSMTRIKMVGPFDILRCADVRHPRFCSADFFRLSMETRCRDPQAVDLDCFDYDCRCRNRSLSADEDYRTAILEQCIYAILYSAAGGIRSLVPQANSSRDVRGRAIFDCDVADRNSGGRYAPMDSLRQLDAGDSKGDQRMKSGWRQHRTSAQLLQNRDYTH
jgi:hypothetical protein